MPTVDIIIRTIDQTKGSIQGVTQSLAKLAGQALLFERLARAISFSVQEAAEAQKVDAQLAAVLESTGNAAGMTRDELEGLATELSRMSTFDDDAIKGAEALLLTFTKIGEDVFPQATQAILDMSVAMGQDLKSSTIQIGKALNDPIKGITALQRVGVSFTEDQKQMIATLVETGRTMEAQEIILEELSREFGGSAASAANTYEGQIKQLKNEVGNLAEEIGTRLLPALTKTAGGMTDFLRINAEANRLMESGENTYRRAALAQATLEEVSRRTAQSTEELSTATDGATDSAQEFATAFIDAAAAAEEAAQANQMFLNALGNMQSEYESYSEEYTRISGDISLSDEERKLALQNLEAEHELATQKIVLGLLEQKLAMDGLTDEELNLLLEKGLAWGIYSEQVVTETRKAIAEANLLAETLNGLPTSKTFTYTMTVGGDVGAVMSNSVANQRVTRRAGGGGVNRGQPYMVGEQGTELFVPQQSGTIIPNNRLGSDDAIASMTDKIVSAIMMSRINEARFASLIKENALQVTK